MSDGAPPSPFLPLLRPAPPRASMAAAGPVREPGRVRPAQAPGNPHPQRAVWGGEDAPTQVLPVLPRVPAPSRPRPRRRPRSRRVVRRLLIAVLAALAAGIVALAAGWSATPPVDDAPRLVAAQLADHHAPALSGPVPARVAAALIATEDSRFYGNPGVDYIGVLRAPFGAVTGQDQGGSTLEQQLAKNLYGHGATGPAAQAAQVVLALKLDQAFSKQQILRMYLDDGYYGAGLYGLTAATRGYFGKEPGQLSWAQASLLAGLFQAPSAYDPLTHPAAARARQAHVLDRLVAQHVLSRADADTVGSQPWGLRGR